MTFKKKKKTIKILSATFARKEKHTLNINNNMVIYMLFINNKYDDRELSNKITLFCMIILINTKLAPLQSLVSRRSNNSTYRYLSNLTLHLWRLSESI